MRFYTVEQLGPKQSFTPEGYLLIKDVPIARTGVQIYGPNETPIEAGPDGIVKIDREADQVFRPATIASGEGKDIVDDHPPENLNPDNWREFTVGHVQNVRRGSGAQDDLTLGDLLIKDKNAIAAVRGGKRQVSVGYDAEYQATGPGRGRQYDIIINHVALVDHGRCGPRCSIGDRSMPKGKGKTWKERLMRVFDAANEEELAAKLSEEAPDAPVGDEEEGPGGVTVHNHIHGGMPNDTPGASTDEEPEWFKAHKADMDARFKAIDDAIGPALKKWAEQESEEPAHQEGADEEMEEEFEEEAPPGTGDKARNAKDSAYFEDSFQDTVAAAEILAPGIRLPTFDKKAKPAATMDALTALRRRALDEAYVVDPGMKEFIESASSKRPFTARDLKPAALRALFRSAAAAKKRGNVNDARGLGHVDNGAAKAVPVTLAAIQRRNEEHYGLKH